MNETERDYSRLLCELDAVRKLVLQLLPEEARLILDVRMAQGEFQVRDWRRLVVPQILALVRPELDWQNRERAACPLCKEGPQQGAFNTFTVPEGLTRHLEGSHNFYRCAVMVVAERLAKGGIGL